MLLDVVQASEAGGFIIVKDTIEYSGLGILKCIINAALKRGDDVHVLGFETSESEMQAGLDGTIMPKLHFHKGFPDPLGWSGTSSVTVRHFSSEDINRLIREAHQAKASVLVIDSLSFLLRHHDSVFTCQRLQELKKGQGGHIKTIVGLLHSDLHQQGAVGSVCHIANTVISVALAKNDCRAVALTVRRTKSGKVIEEEEYFSVTEDANLIVQNRPHHAGHLQNDQGVAEIDPTSNLTFNLHLSEEERKAKEKVALPFVFNQEKKSALLKPAAGTGRIMYEPDANDDYDEEDPDDDLDV